MKRFLIFLFGSIFIITCSTANHKVKDEHGLSKDELIAFAEANCFFWYFKKMGYDLQEIRAISGGMVEMGSYSAEKYRQVSLLVKDYKPSITTKQQIDIDLLKCFNLSEDIEFIQSIEKIK
jgi:hypothetical protein